MTRKSRSYFQSAEQLQQDLKEFFDREELRRLHKREPIKHFAFVAWQFLLLFGCGWILWSFSNPLIWIPTALVMGFTIFNFTVLLHEQVHRLIFNGRYKKTMRFLGWLYAFPSGISATQFKVWHTDHHENLGDDEEDPKRFHLSPKRVARWYKLLYCTPVLFPIYFRAARAETATYDEATQKTISLERTLTIGGHLAIAALLWWGGGWEAMARVWAVPYFFVFPVAFTLNRLGQHYFINPDDPAAWGTRVDGNWFWRLAFLNSNHHLEHHYFQSVPLYNLPELNRQLRPFFEQRGIRNFGYGEMLYGWFIKNHVPHTKMEDEPVQATMAGSPQG